MATIKLVREVRQVKRDISVTGFELAVVFDVVPDVGEEPFQIVIPRRLLESGEVTAVHKGEQIAVNTTAITGRPTMEPKRAPAEPRLGS